MKWVATAVLVALSAVGAGSALAQTSTGSIAGVVKDGTGAMLPGVTVEASSPALIERVRTAVTDGGGQYNLVELPPGTYGVTFTLPGFSSLRRERIQLTTGFTATVNAELSLGNVAETITVSGQSPVLDVQNVRQATVLTREVVDAIPTAKQFQALGTLVPGMVLNGVGGGASQDVGGGAGQSHAIMNIHGGRAIDQKLFVDGMGFLASTAPGTNGFYFTDGNFQEIVLDVAASSAEQETGGVRVNMVPRDGGNAFRGMFLGNFSSHALSGTNITDDLRRRGLRDPNNIKSIWSANPTIGGPIVRDRLWFFTSYTRAVTDSYIAGTYYNTTPGTPYYSPDLTRQAVDDFWATDAAVRLTWQTTPRNKVTLYYDYNLNCHCHFSVSPTVTPDASYHMTYLSHLVIGSWTAPVTSRLLFEAGAMAMPQLARWDKQLGSAGPQVTDSGRGLTFGNSSGRSYYDEPTENVRGSMSYVTGSHVAKFGFQALFKSKTQRQERDGNMAYTFLNGVPTTVTYYPTPATDVGYVRPSLGIFAQDQWSVRRLSVNAGLRFDYLRYGYPETTLSPVPNIPTTRSFPAVIKGDFKDLSPRLGVAYNLFGTGRTALKASINRYVGAGINNVTGAVSALGTDPRRWTDTNGNFVPDCDPTLAVGNGECGPSANGRFAQAFVPLRYDPAFFGYGSRPLSNWETSAGIHHELMSRFAVNATYFRRHFATFQVTQNTAVSPSDYQPYCVSVPNDSRLPNAGQPLCGLFDLIPTKVGLSDPMVTSASRLGKQSEHWQGLDVGINARLAKLLLQGGFSTGKTVADHCDIVRAHPEVQANSSVGATYTGINSGPSVSSDFCRVETPFLSQVKLLGTYTLPWDLRVAGTLQNIPGPLILANAVYTSAQVAQSLGRPLSSAATVTVNLIKPGTLYGERTTQLDLRMAKRFRFGGRSVEGQIDVYNALNENAVNLVNNTYGATSGPAAGQTWIVPQRILPPRMVKFGIQVDF